jgi:two-component system nitrogen regulation sensor histidine kinase NtrY
VTEAVSAKKEHDNGASETVSEQIVAPVIRERTRRVSGYVGMITVFAALLSALSTFLVLAGVTPILPTHDVVVWLLAGNGLLLLILLSLVTWEIFSLYRARQARAAGSGLHTRVVTGFALAAGIPAVLVAAVATITLDRGLDPWFTGSIKALMSNTVGIARAYREVQCRALARETSLMAADIDRARRLFDADRKLFRDFMLSRSVFLGFPVTMIVAPDASVMERIEVRPLENLAPVTQQDIDEASDRDPLCLIPATGNIYRAVLKLSTFDGAILFVARPVDPQAVSFVPIAEAGVAYYQALEQKKTGIQVAFASMFALVTLILMLSAIWFGLNFANRLVAPIRRLIHAADQVATGNFYVQVPLKRAEGDLAHLSHTFNKMTAELRRQHDSLTAATDQIDDRRRFTEAVLSGVSSAVIGLDQEARISLINPSAKPLLVRTPEGAEGQPLVTILPEIEPLLKEAMANRHRRTQGQITIQRGGLERIVNVRFTHEQEKGADHGLVLTLDDITDLVSAQRTSAWADVARRIAHEIKNPLTPIQLSAERIKRKYSKVIIEDKDVFDQCVETIVRQVDDIKRMVDEFSSFARMPKPAMVDDDLSDVVRQVVFLMRVGHPALIIHDLLPSVRVMATFDRRLIAQALTNIIKNAAEALLENAPNDTIQGQIDVWLSVEAHTVSIRIIDNGKGFPVENRQKLLEPYMTTRAGGTGLGLAIVGKIMEDHGGGIELLDHPESASGQTGACVRLWFPLSEETKSE